MGEIYRARDTKLDRQVAIKVLPSALASDPERLARFDREGKVLALLDHPTIGHIHGIVDSEDSRALVLALIEGPTLADLTSGPNDFVGRLRVDFVPARGAYHGRV
jgi:serine/threonine protein kinase